MTSMAGPQGAWRRSRKRRSRTMDDAVGPGAFAIGCASRSGSRPECSNEQRSDADETTERLWLRRLLGGETKAQRSVTAARTKANDACVRTSRPAGRRGDDHGDVVTAVQRSHAGHRPEYDWRTTGQPKKRSRGSIPLSTRCRWPYDEEPRTRQYDGGHLYTRGTVRPGTYPAVPVRRRSFFILDGSSR